MKNNKNIVDEAMRKIELELSLSQNDDDYLRAQLANLNLEKLDHYQLCDLASDLLEKWDGTKKFDHKVKWQFSVEGYGINAEDAFKNAIEKSKQRIEGCLINWYELEMNNLLWIDEKDVETFRD